MQVKTEVVSIKSSTGEVRQYPMVRFDTGLTVYEEVLIDGQYFIANWSPMGRPKSTEQIWQKLKGGVTLYRPLRRRQHSFQLELNGQLLVHHWKWINAEKQSISKKISESVITLENELFPVSVKIHTQLDETPFLVRWLEIKNKDMSPPLALAQVFPSLV